MSHWCRRYALIRHSWLDSCVFVVCCRGQRQSGVSQTTRHARYEGRLLVEFADECKYLEFELRSMSSTWVPWGYYMSFRGIFHPLPLWQTWILANDFNNKLKVFSWVWEYEVLGFMYSGLSTTADSTHNSNERGCVRCFMRLLILKLLANTFQFFVKNIWIYSYFSGGRNIFRWWDRANLRFIYFFGGRLSFTWRLIAFGTYEWYNCIPL